jgi:uncharacterized protein (DUF302 family)
MSVGSFAKFAIETQLDLPYEAALEKVLAALKAEGFGALTFIDVKATLHERIGAEFRKYAIIGACNPPLAHRALSADLGVGLLLPCNVVVYEEGEGTAVAMMAPIAMLGVADAPGLLEVAQDAEAKLRRAAASLSAA